MVTITKTYEKISPKLDDMVRRGYCNIELKYGDQYEIYAHGERKLLTKDFIHLYPEKTNEIPENFPPEATVIVEETVLLYKPRNTQFTKSMSRTHIKHQQAFNMWCYTNPGCGKGYTHDTANIINSTCAILLIAVIIFSIWWATTYIK